MILFFFFNDTATTEIYTLSLHDALPISYVPLLDMQESCYILEQLLDKIPASGEVRAKLQPNPKGPPGEAYRRVESGRGALGYYIVSDGTPKPYRVKISVGSFRNILALPHLLVGQKIGRASCRERV